VVVDLAARHDGDLLVQKVDELPQDARLALAAQSQEDEVVPRQQGVLDRRDDGLLIPDDARKQRAPLLHPADEVETHLLLHGDDLGPGLLQVPDGLHFLCTVSCVLGPG
jgi:hypothetical protein